MKKQVLLLFPCIRHLRISRTDSEERAAGNIHEREIPQEIGNDFIADTMDMSLVDRVIKVNDDEAFAASRLLAAKEGILAGSSSGAALAASLRLAKTIERGNIVVVFPDRGDRYLSKGLFDIQ